MLCQSIIITIASSNPAAVLRMSAVHPSTRDWTSFVGLHACFTHGEMHLPPSTWLKPRQTKNIHCIMSIMKKKAEEENQHYKKVEKKYKKPGLCKDFSQNGKKCDKGDTCSFSHGYRDQKKCTFWPQGKCNRGDACLYSHDLEAGGTPELLYPPKFREVFKLCKYYRFGGGCNDPVKCEFVHTPPGECRHWQWGQCEKSTQKSTSIPMRCTGSHIMNMMELYLEDRREWKKSKQMIQQVVTQKEEEKKREEENEVKARRRKRSRSVSEEKKNNKSVSPLPLRGNNKKGGRRSRSAPQQRLDMGRKPN